MFSSYIPNYNVKSIFGQLQKKNGQPYPEKYCIVTWEVPENDHSKHTEKKYLNSSFGCKHAMGWNSAANWWQSLKLNLLVWQEMCEFLPFGQLPWQPSGTWACQVAIIVMTVVGYSFSQLLGMDYIEIQAKVPLFPMHYWDATWAIRRLISLVSLWLDRIDWLRYIRKEMFKSSQYWPSVW